MADTANEQIGIVGVGRMGLAMLKHLIRHGHAVIACDLDRKQCEAARAAGGVIAASPAEVGRAARFVIIAVGYDDEATAVMLGEHGLLETMGAGSVIAVSSTCAPEHVRWLEEEARQKGVELLDAPICRGARLAAEGTLLALFGGKPEVVERARPVYRAFCSDVAHLGEVGAGQFGKSMNNYLLWVNGVALIEAGRLSEAAIRPTGPAGSAAERRFGAHDFPVRGRSREAGAADPGSMMRAVPYHPRSSHPSTYLPDLIRRPTRFI